MFFAQLRFITGTAQLHNLEAYALFAYSKKGFSHNEHVFFVSQEGANKLMTMETFLIYFPPM